MVQKEKSINALSKKMTWVLLFSTLAFLGCSSKPPTSAISALVWNPWNSSPNPGEPISASGNTGFYVQPYPGSSLSSVVLWLVVNTAGTYSFSLAATDSTKAAAIGTVSSGSVSIVNDSSYHPVTFTYSGNPAVTKGDQVSFAVSVQTVPSGTASGSFCTQASAAGNTNLVLTSGGTAQTTGVAVVINGGG